MEHPFKDHDGAHAPTPIDSSRSSPAPQKRVRGYGEELKGLSPSGDESSPRGQSILTFKRQKLVYNTRADGSDSESLDDGEIVESPSHSHVARLVSTEPSSQAHTGPQSLDTTRVLSENDEITTSPGAEEGFSQTREFNEERDPGETRAHENRSSAIGHHTPSSVPGWNRGIQLGTRTTFGAKPTSSSPQTQLAAVQPMNERKEEQTKMEKKRVRPREPVSSFEASNSTWNFPLNAPEVVAPENISEDDDFWATLLKNWIIHLVRENGETADRLTYKVVRSGWSLYFTKRMGFLQGTKKHITATRVVAQNFMTSLDKDIIETMISDARQKHPANLSDDNVSTTVLFIVLWGRTQNADLPRAELPVLRDGDICQEKLALADDELDGCVFCSADHPDQDCFEIWTSFKPSELNVRKVKTIPAFCYVCGGEDHYGPECSLADHGDKTTGRTTWSKANHDLYIDPECEDIAIAWTDVDPSQLMRGEFHIPGRATRKTHTYFVSSEESEDDLIHPPVKKPQSRGEIRIASNIGTTNGNSRGRGGSHKGWQPPLPPGPPPPLAERGPRKPFQSAPSGTLPPRPQSFSHGRPSGRGRGGYRGRGRGRGRGN
ncbi:hypothetical protein E0Z10_g71 [Xylaria hypoxylon]|uniref:CCHC-type domain-containing protein n=1 Tax=Xylaria hypoxylon TaxID=37992 RepID=A0A4Z0Z8X7_9PEZI|nr:hypothetical protein E0Z10_g71 [Xylaria hypoxylon]